jgi:type III secretion protein J
MANRSMAALLVLMLAGCSAPVAVALDDSEADRVVVALGRAHLDATKEPDPSVEGKWQIEVDRDDVPRALAVLHDENLPRPRPASVLDAMNKGGALVPSEVAEHAQLLAGTAGDLERTLLGVEGVLAARVHLNVPPAGSASRGGRAAARERQRAARAPRADTAAQQRRRPAPRRGWRGWPTAG